MYLFPIYTRFILTFNVANFSNWLFYIHIVLYLVIVVQLVLNFCTKSILHGKITNMHLTLNINTILINILGLRHF